MPASDGSFPRGKGAPTQSPLFWVQQKHRYLRQLLIRDIEELSGRRFAVFFGNRFARGSDIQAGDIAYVAEILGDIEGAPLDILVETNGGETDATEAIISIIRQVTPSFRVVIGNAAKSNGTMLALAAESILMGVTSELGPIEPAIGGHPASTLIRDEVKEKDFPFYMAGHQALRNSSMMADRLLRNGMMKVRARKILSPQSNRLPHETIMRLMVR